jgi:hypothetical protein
MCANSLDFVGLEAAAAPVLQQTRWQQGRNKRYMPVHECHQRWVEADPAGTATSRMHMVVI